MIALVDFLDRNKRSDSRFREKMLQEILLVLKKHRNKRYFDNSHVHRLKQRAMQALLVLARFLNDVSPNISALHRNQFVNETSVMPILFPGRSTKSLP